MDCAIFLVMGFDRYVDPESVIGQGLEDMVFWHGREEDVSVVEWSDPGGTDDTADGLMFSVFIDKGFDVFDDGVAMEFEVLQ